MGRAKQIEVKVIPSKIGNSFIKRYHYSKSVVQNSVLHFGCFLDGKLHGVLQYGNSIDKRNCIKFVDSGLSENDAWNTFLELNRMAFDDYLPKNSESRCIAITMRLIKRHAPHIKWILSYADGTQCGDGTIYRASGFQLCGINKNSTIYKMADGSTKAKHGTSKANFDGAVKLEGFQLRYIYLIDKSCQIALPLLTFDQIDKHGARMYKGEKPADN
jgi:hypothetical protein